MRVSGDLGYVEREPTIEGRIDRKEPPAEHTRDYTLLACAHLAERDELIKSSRDMSRHVKLIKSDASKSRHAMSSHVKSDQVTDLRPSRRVRRATHRREG
jgi:hypothetical protein